ncbi:MAG: hypothetical protein MAG453_00557 [Calditrichaeota bacterium]|nr:hypothetical protein [Calditrichota bacterium]
MPDYHGRRRILPSSKLQWKILVRAGARTDPGVGDPGLRKFLARVGARGRSRWRIAQ